ncbi:MAG: hypothetical protein ACJ8G7_16540 [Rhizobacter sp.]
MAANPKVTLRELEGAAPGTRFHRIYRKRQQSAHPGWKNAAFIGGGLLTIAAGVAAYPVPVIPSEILIVIGLAVLAQGSRRGAIILDGTEVRLRRWFAPALKVWRRWPKWGKVSAGVAWSVAVAGFSYWAYVALSG